MYRINIFLFRIFNTECSMMFRNTIIQSLKCHSNRVLALFLALSPLTILNLCVFWSLSRYWALRHCDINFFSAYIPTEILSWWPAMTVLCLINNPRSQRKSKINLAAQRCVCEVKTIFQPIKILNFWWLTRYFRIIYVIVKRSKVKSTGRKIAFLIQCNALCYGNIPSDNAMMIFWWN